MSSHQKVGELLAKWDELREQGQVVAPEDLCADAEESLPELKVQIDLLRQMDWLDELDEESNQLPPLLKSESPDEPRIGQAKVPAILGGRYVMESLMAEGGFGQVWRATDTSLQRPVAAKVTTVNCFSEARRVAQLKHHGIVTVHDVGNQNGLCYIIFNLVEGMTLADRIKQDTLTWQESAAIIVEVAKSLQFAHEKGFIHRDIKPANILLDEHGGPVLADFGIAVTECELQHEVVTSAGTLAYMAPEQLQLQGMIDARTDVYGLGVVFYEMLTGRQPFSDPTLSGLREHILAGNPPLPNSLNPTIPDEYGRICLKCLSINMNDRYPTAKDLADALSQASMM